MSSTMATESTFCGACLITGVLTLSSSYRACNLPDFVPYPRKIDTREAFKQSVSYSHHQDPSPATVQSHLIQICHLCGGVLIS